MASEGEKADVQSLSCVWLFATPWTAACQASLSFTISQSLLKLMSIESVRKLECEQIQISAHFSEEQDSGKSESLPGKTILYQHGDRKITACEEKKRPL